MIFDIIDIQSLGEYLNPSGFISIDLGLDNNGDIIFNSDGSIGNVSGTLKLIQDIRLFLLSPLRISILDPNWGNPAIDDIGRAPMNTESINHLIQGALLSLKQFKDNEQKLRGFPLEGAELISSVGVPQTLGLGFSGQTHLGNPSAIVTQSSPNAFSVRIFVTDGQHNEQSIDLTLGE